MLRTTFALLAGALLMLSPAAASAAELSYDGGVLVYQGGDGPDTPTIALGDTARFDGIGAAPATCTVVGEEAACPVDPGAGVRITLGGGNDVPSVLEPERALPVVVDGGPGDDRLTGTPGGETLIGGPGNDTLDGLAGPDVLDAGDGDDRLVGDGTATRSPDVLDGGPGHDTVEDWSLTPGLAPISLTLDAGADDGFAQEGDDVRGVEAVWTTSPGHLVGSEAADQLFANNGSVVSEGRGGDDELRASDGADTLDGGADADKLVGGFGDDRLVGGAGRDSVIADIETDLCTRYTCRQGTGNDLVEVRDGEPDSVDCGVGTDRVIADASDVIAPSCETVERSGATAAPPSSPADASVDVAPTTLRAALSKGLKVTVNGVRPGRRTVTVTRRAKTVARRTAKIPGTGRATLRVKFTRAARRTLRNRRSVTLRVRVDGAQASVTLKR